MKMKKRAVAASAAYLERSGQVVLRPETKPAPSGIDVISIEGDTLVGTVVRAKRSPTQIPTVPERTLDAALKATTDYRDRHVPQCGRVRVDVIALLILSEDRALLRHHRGERGE